MDAAHRQPARRRVRVGPLPGRRAAGAPPTSARSRPGWRPSAPSSTSRRTSVVRARPWMAITKHVYHAAMLDPCTAATLTLTPSSRCVTDDRRPRRGPARGFATGDLGARIRRAPDVVVRHAGEPVLRGPLWDPIGALLYGSTSVGLVHRLDVAASARTWSYATSDDRSALLALARVGWLSSSLRRGESLWPTMPGYSIDDAIADLPGQPARTPPTTEPVTRGAASGSARSPTTTTRARALPDGRRSTVPGARRRQRLQRHRLVAGRVGDVLRRQRHRSGRRVRRRPGRRSGRWPPVAGRDRAGGCCARRAHRRCRRLSLGRAVGRRADPALHARRRLDREVLLPVDRATSVAFGGPNLDALYVTTACYGTLGWRARASRWPVRCSCMTRECGVGPRTRGPADRATTIRNSDPLAAARQTPRLPERGPNMSRTEGRTDDAPTPSRAVLHPACGSARSSPPPYRSATRPTAPSSKASARSPGRPSPTSWPALQRPAPASDDVITVRVFLTDTGRFGEMNAVCRVLRRAVPFERPSTSGCLWVASSRSTHSPSSTTGRRREAGAVRPLQSRNPAGFAVDGEPPATSPADRRFDSSTAPSSPVGAGGCARSLARLAPTPCPKSIPARCGSALRRPGKVVCIGLNYADHAAESGPPLPAEPVVFMKDPATVVGPYDDVYIPRSTVKTDWEVEFGLSSGRRPATSPTDDAAHEVIAGYRVARRL